MPTSISWRTSACTLGVLVALAGMPSAARAQGARVNPAFKPLEFLVGSCWTGTFPDGKQTDTHCFEWLYDRHFIRVRHVVRGGPPYEGESTYRVDPKTS